METEQGTTGLILKSATRPMNTTNAYSRRGALMGIAGEPVQVRNHDGAGVDTSEGSFLRS